MSRSTLPRIRLAEATIDADDLRSLAEWLAGNPWLTMGELTRRFERRWAEWLGVRHAVYVNSGSSANLLAYAALDLSGRLRNRKVVVPAVSWATTVAPAFQLGFEPIACDADEKTFGLDPDHLESICRQHEPAAVVLVHVLGVPAAMETIQELQDRYGFVLFEDSCAATGSRYDGRRVGTFGAISTFSFYFGHHISTIEGGMVCTDDEALWELLLQLRSHGWANELPPARAKELADAHGIAPFNRRFTFYVPGFNVRPTDLGAYLGLRQMEKIDAVVAARIRNHRRYAERLGRTGTLAIQSNARAEISSISFAALASTPSHRERIARALSDAGIETRPLGGGNMTRQPFWRARLHSVTLPMADRIHDTAFHLPNHPGLTADDIDFVCDTVLGVEAE